MPAAGVWALADDQTPSEEGEEDNVGTGALQLGMAAGIAIGQVQDQVTKITVWVCLVAADC